MINHFPAIAILASLFVVSCGSQTLDSKNKTGSNSPAPNFDASQPLELEPEGFGVVSFDRNQKNPTCKKSATHFALDIDGDGKIDPAVDGPLLAMLMTRGTPVSKIAPFFKRGNRSDIRLYFDQVLKPLIDVDGNRVVSLAVEGAIIPFYMLAINGMNRAQMLKTIARFKTTESKLKKLMALKIRCNSSNAYTFKTQIGLSKTSNYFRNWGGKGNLWFWSKQAKGWVFLDSSLMLRLWTRGTNPAQGQGIGVLPRFYQQNPDYLFDGISPK